ncbi:hypothetical protein [Methylobacterium crusticola]|nr:hypothetical protein [Methylobacterium crusticola]
MRSPPLATAAKLAAVLCVALTVAAAWSFYQHPAMGLLLDTFRFCG